MSGLTAIDPTQYGKKTDSPLAKPLSAAKAAPLGGQGDADKGFFGTLLDVVNPLQHIPIVSNLYQAATGDVPSMAASVIGGGLFGGVIGVVASMANEALKATTGDDLAGTLAGGAKAIAASGKTPGVPGAMPLTPNSNAEALETAANVEAGMAGSTPAVAPAAPAPHEGGDLARYRDASLGLKDPEKGKQQMAKLDKIALQMG